MLDAMHYGVDADGNSCFMISLADFGVEVEVSVTLADPTVSEWEAPQIEVFQNDVNLLIEQARADLHRLIRSTSRNTQLAAYGLPSEFSDEDHIEAEVDAV